MSIVGIEWDETVEQSRLILRQRAVEAANQRLRAAQERLQEANSELYAAEREHRLAVEEVKTHER